MRSYILSIWSILDPIYFICTRLTSLPSLAGERQIFRVRLTKYMGKSIVLSDGTSINKNDVLVKIHLHNVRILKEIGDTKSELKKARIIYRFVQHSLPAVELYIRQHPHADQIKGIIGITLLNKGCERLGFEVRDPSNPLYLWFKWLAFMPIEFLSNRRLLSKNRMPKYLFMSTKKLENLYKK